MKALVAEALPLLLCRLAQEKPFSRSDVKSSKDGTSDAFVQSAQWLSALSDRLRRAAAKGSDVGLNQESQVQIMKFRELATFSLLISILASPGVGAADVSTSSASGPASLAVSLQASAHPDGDGKAHTDIETATKSTVETHGPAPEVINNPNPESVDTRATEVKPANPESMEFGYVPKLRPFATGNGKFRVKKAEQRKTMALALGGGGVRGAAHVGVLRVLEREKIPIDYIVGNSMGAIIGGMYSAGVSLDELSEEQSFEDFRKSYVPTWSAKVIKLPLSLLWSPFRTGPVGIMTGQKYQKFLERHIPEGKECIESLNIPYSAVVTNLIDGQAYRISEGDLATAMRASSTLAPIIRPVKIGDKLCVDGGVRANLPASAARDTGAEVVVAVLVDEPLRKVPEKCFRHYRAVTERLTDIVLAVTDEQQLQFADIVIRPDVRGISIFSKKRKDIERALKAGEIAAEKALPLIRKKMNLPQITQITETSRSQ